MPCPGTPGSLAEAVPALETGPTSVALSLSPRSSSTTTCTAALRTSASGSILAMAVRQEVTCGDGIVSRGHEGIPQSSRPQWKDGSTPHPGQLYAPLPAPSPPDWLSVGHGAALPLAGAERHADTLEHFIKSRQC